ncbi:MAG: glycosyltransferase [Arcobacter sp.]|nr:glycosyltransferase [Arcobacter sp.]
MNKIVLVLKGRIESLPPFMSLAIELSRLNHKVVLIASQCDDKTKILFQKYHIEVITVGSVRSPKNKIGKLIQWLDFRNQTFNELKQMDFDYLWIGGGDTALALGKKLYSYNYMITLYELYDTNHLYRYFLKNIVQSASAVVVPERNRAAIIRSWFGLQQTPFVIPNKPYIADDLFYDNDEKPESFSPHNKKIALYQGHIGRDRDLEPICKAFENVKERWQLVLMGKDHGYLKELKEICPSLIHIDHIDAPGHLKVTKQADVGLVSYTFDNLNNVFCAPNKIWEYSSFHKPMIGNDVPGLLDTIEKYEAGICVDFSDPKALYQSILIVEENYTKYSEGSKKLTESFDPARILEEIIN